MNDPNLYTTPKLDATTQVSEPRVHAIKPFSRRLVIFSWCAMVIAILSLLWMISIHHVHHGEGDPEDHLAILFFLAGIATFISAVIGIIRGILQRSVRTILYVTFPFLLSSGFIAFLVWISIQAINSR
jgi:hypothetical protein